MIPFMAISRRRDRSGLVTRNRVIAYLERESRNKHPSNQNPIIPPDPNKADYVVFFMNGLMGSAPNQTLTSLI